MAEFDKLSKDENRFVFTIVKEPTSQFLSYLDMVKVYNALDLIKNMILIF